MELFNGLMLDVWREVCRQIEIERSAATIARILAHRMPLDGLVVLGLDWEAASICVRATGLGPMPHFCKAPRPLQPSQEKQLRAWAHSREVLTHHEDEPAGEVASLLLPPRPQGHWLVGALWNEREPTGALLLHARSPGVFEPIHTQMLRCLLEPFAVTLENDRRLHELNTLREAAEADKRSALSRLGRTELSDTIVGIEGGLAPVMERVDLIARSDIPVLIFGETGTGKEVIARAIHEHSPRVRKPFIRVNCGAIPPELLDSELFGHEKGAFTGATATRHGWFERADEGTLLLDEIGELPLPAQVRLLRVLQEGTFERVGGEKLIKVDVRIIASTHRDLPAMVQNGKFREDLWYRISSFPIVLPPLRERKPDIPALAEHFALRAARRFGLKPQQPALRDLRLLAAYDWPGNIREFASVIDRAAILGDGDSLEISRALGYNAASAYMPPESPADQPHPAPPQQQQEAVAPLEDAMRLHIESALRQTRGRIEGDRGAATALQINPHTLRARMRKLGIDWNRFRDPD